MLPAPFWTGPATAEIRALLEPQAFRLTPTASCDRDYGGQQSPCDHQRWPCGRGNHGGACGQACSADRYVSSDCSWCLDTRPEIKTRPKAPRPRFRKTEARLNVSQPEKSIRNLPKLRSRRSILLDMGIAARLRAMRGCYHPGLAPFYRGIKGHFPHHGSEERYRAKRTGA